MIAFKIIIKIEEVKPKAKKKDRKDSTKKLKKTIRTPENQINE